MTITTIDIVVMTRIVVASATDSEDDFMFARYDEEKAFNRATTRDLVHNTRADLYEYGESVNRTEYRYYLLTIGLCCAAALVGMALNLAGF